MNENMPFGVYLIIIVFFILGYAGVNFLYNLAKGVLEKKRTDNRQKGYAQDKREEFPDNLEMTYMAILGISQYSRPSEIKKRYHDLMKQYHPDKVEHLGDEFKRLADLRSREISEAYTYFQKKYNIQGS